VGQRNVLLINGPGTDKSHLAIAIARACIRNGERGKFFNVEDLVNRFESETRQGRQGRLADYPGRLGFIFLDEPGYLPFTRPAVSCCSTLSVASTSAPRSSTPPTLTLHCEIIETGSESWWRAYRRPPRFAGMAQPRASRGDRGFEGINHHFRRKSCARTG
jgi:DNA replication protein DnaC